MLTAQLFGRLLTATTRTCQLTTKRFASTSSMFQTTDKFMLDKAILQYTPLKETASTASVSQYISRLRPFNAPSVPQPNMTTPPVNKVVEELELTSVLRKRRLKMNKHKHKKLMKRTRALRKKLGK
ncbi:hypothetical protein EDC94DRAFT_609081 [Helicostylum pulchrum]|nr:hypothetical protein EDC94DRAFT_609081 [Helicostylum pulchrum]